jgi:mevalonate kinase
VVIVGGGFGGLYTALALAEQRRPPSILLIEPAERFVFLPLLYELLSGELRHWEIAPRYEELLAGRGVAWLQDRVVQTYGGLVHMDFSPPLVPRASALVGGVYTKVDLALLPPMYLAYNTLVGGDSGKVHSTVKERWAQREPGLVAGMQELAGLADEALVALRGTDAKRLASLMTKNFGCRRRLYGDDVVGMKNIAVIDLLFSLGLSAKFTGSGGAIVCMRSDGLGWLEADHEDKVVAAVLEHGFELIRVVPAGP